MQISISPNSFGFSIQLAALLFLLFTTDASRAIEPSTSLAQYAHRAWRFGDAGLLGTPRRIAQTADGYIWASTSDGIFRFDGVRFTRWIPPAGESLPGNSVEEIFGARDGSLYVGRDSGLSRITNGHIYNYPGSPRRPGPFVQDVEGNVWMGTSGALNDSSTLCKVGDKSIRCMGIKDGFVCDNGMSNTIDANGYMWIGSYRGTCSWKPGTKPQAEVVPILAKQTGELDVGSMASGSDGALWAGISYAAPGAGLLRFANGKWNSYIAPGIDGRKLAVTALLAGREGSLWIGTIDQGLFKLANGQLDHFSAVNGLSGDQVQSIFEDHEGGVWVVTQTGIDYFRDYDVLSFSLNRGSVGAVAADRQGMVFFGDRALTALHDGVLTQIKDQRGHVIDGAVFLFNDSRDRLWIASEDRLLLLTNERTITEIGSYPNEYIVYITEDRDHDIWVSLQNFKTRVPSLMRVHDGQVVATYYETGIAEKQPMNALAPNPAGGIWAGGLRHGLFWFHNGHFERVFAGGFDGRVEDLLTERSGALWIVTANGFIRYADGRVKTLTASDGLPCDNGVDVQEDGQGSIWFYLHCGIMRVPEAELASWWSKSNTPIYGKVFGPLDGAQPGYSNGRPAQTPDGRLWSASTHLYQLIDPYHLPLNSIRPPTNIETFEADGKDYVPGHELRLPIHTRQIAIGYAGLSFLIPEKVHFRYRLRGYDSTWTDAENRRQVFYNDLPPGHYVFHVIACNNDGVWNTHGSEIAFFIPPAWYQMLLVRILAIVAAAALCFLLYLYRLRRYAASLKLRFDERLEERTRLARDLHDTLLQTIQGTKFVADQTLADVEDPAAKISLKRISEWLERASREGRAALDSLRSSVVESNDLAAAFRRTFEDCSVNTGMRIKLSIIGKSKELHPIVRDEVYRIGDEAIRNACLHSHGRWVIIEIIYNRNIHVHIRDDGRGIDPDTLRTGKPGHYGLTGMRERAERIGATLTISSLQSGTEIILRVPGRVIYKSGRKAASLTSRN